MLFPSLRCLLLSLVCAGLLHADGIARFLEIPYVEGGGMLQRLDIYTPVDAQNRGVIVYVHGGGWSGGDKAKVGGKVELFTGLGYVFVSVNYRLSPAVQHPAHIKDVAAAIAWVHANISEYGGDPSRIGICGHSAGAHLVALVATDAERLAVHGLGLDVIRGVVPIDIGVYDMAVLIESARGKKWISVFSDDPERLRDASPLWQAEVDTGIPPFLMLMAGEEQGKARGMDAMLNRLAELGVAGSRVTAPRKTHGTINQQLGTVDDKITQAVVDFFAATLASDATSER